MFFVKIPDCKQLLLTPQCHYLKNTNVSDFHIPTGTVKCTLIPGDGVGPELVKLVQTIFKAAKVPIEFEKHIFSELHPEQSESLENVFKSIKKNRVSLQGTIAVPDISPDGNPHNWNMRLREALDIYANVVHIKSFKGVPSKQCNTDFVIIRDQTEGSYKENLEHETLKGVVESLKIITRKKSERIARFAFNYAITHNRNSLVAVHKANIFRITDGLFLESCRKIAADYPKIVFDDLSTGRCAFELTRNPQQFDIILTPSLYGAILENVGVGVVGGAGIVPGSSYSPQCAIFEPGSRHIYQKAAGMNIANPTAMILSSIKLLKHVKLVEYADVIENALLQVLKAGKVRTPDMGGESSTQHFTDAVIAQLDLSTIESLNRVSLSRKCNIIYRLSTCM